MSDQATSLSGHIVQDLQSEIIRLNKIIQALMNRAERAMSVQGSDFGLFETAVRLEEEVKRRTEQWEKALRENERINHALQHTQRQMEVEIVERKRVEESLRQANQCLETLTITDPLTGLANRRRFAETLTAEWHRALRTRVPIGLAMIDTVTSPGTTACAVSPPPWLERCGKQTWQPAMEAKSFPLSCRTPAIRSHTGWPNVPGPPYVR
jgi:hypothetical protein